MPVTRNDVVQLANRSGIYLLPVESGECRVQEDIGEFRHACCPCVRAEQCPIAGAARDRGEVTLAEYAELFAC